MHTFGLYTALEKLEIAASGKPSIACTISEVSLDLKMGLGSLSANMPNRQDPSALITFLDRTCRTRH